MAWVTQQSAGAEYIRTTEAGVIRITEGSDIRVTETDNSAIWGSLTNSGTWTTATTTSVTWVLAS